jgi:hypothetical protein
MFDAIKNWFSPANESAPESQWDARTVQVQQPGSPAAMNEAVSQQPVRSIIKNNLNRLESKILTSNSKVLRA